MNKEKNEQKKTLISAKQKQFHIYSVIVFIGACVLFYILGGGTQVVAEHTEEEVELSLPSIGHNVVLAEDVFDATEKSSAFRLRKEKEDLIAGSAFDWYNNDTTSTDNTIISSTPISAYENSEEAKLQKTIQQSNDLASSFLNKKEEDKTTPKRNHNGSSASHSSVSSDRAERQARYEQAKERNERVLTEYNERMNASQKKKEEPKKVEKVYAVIDNGSTKKGFYSVNSQTEDNIKDIRAVVHGEYKNISSGSQVKLRLLDNIRIGNVKIPKNTFIYALLSFGNGRAQLKTEQINYNGKMLPFEGIIYDKDGFMGLYIPDNTVSKTKKEAGSDVVSGVDLNISSASGLVTSAVNSVTGAIQSAVSGSIREEKISISANYQLIIKQE